MDVNRVLRRRVRRSFLWAAIGFLVIGALDLARQDYAGRGISPLHHFAIIAFCFAQGLIYAAAWFTTRAPSPYRNNVAVAASLLTLAYAGYDLWQHHADIMDARIPLVGLLLAAAGLYAYAPGGSPANPGADAASADNALEPSAALKPSGSFQPSAASPSRFRADEAAPGQLHAQPARVALIPVSERVLTPAVRMPDSSPAPIATRSASSEELAAAAIAADYPSPDPARWDPVSFIRSSASASPAK